MQSVQTNIAYAALIAGGICLLIYVVDALITLWARSKQSATDVAVAVQTAATAGGAGDATRARPSVAEMSGLVDAIAKLTDSLAKAGPSLTALIGGVLLFAIAAIASGALVGSPPPAANLPAPPRSGGTVPAHAQGFGNASDPAAKGGSAPAPRSR